MMRDHDDEKGMGASRRGFILGGAALALAFARGAQAADPPVEATAELEAANAKLVNDFCAAWESKDGEKLGAFFADDGVFRMNESAKPANGREMITKQLKVFLATTKTAKFDVVRSQAMGNIVLNDRYDRFTMGTKDVAYHMTGVFFIKNGKIQEWWDYGMPKA